MAGVLQHLRSSTLNKRPNPASMVDGQIAINYASGSPGAFFKDTNGNLVKVGPVHVGATAPNVSPASGGTAGNSLGEQWLDTSGGTYVFKVWDGVAWRSEAGEFVNTTGDTMTGALGIIAGSAGSPSLFFSGDSNTGLFSPGADQIALSAGGTGRLFIESNGRVGIGTGSPNTTLDVRGTIRATDSVNYVDVRGDEGAIELVKASGAYIDFKDNFADDFDVRIQQDSNGLVFQTGGNGAASERVRITSAGFVGIGNSSPGARLSIANGSISLQNSSVAAVSDLGISFALDANVQGRIYSPVSKSFAIQAGTAGSLTDAVTVDQSGNVGVGTTSPSVLLHAAGAVRVGADNTSDAVLEIGAGATGNRNAYIDLIGDTTYADHGLRIIRSNGGANAISKIIQRGTGSFTLETTESAPIIFATDNTERLRIDSSGRLLVGTSSARATYLGAGISAGINVEAAGSLGAHNRSISLVNGYADSVDGDSILYLGRTRSNTIGGTTIVQSQDQIGRIAFVGSDGTNMLAAAQIRAEVDGTPGANDMPGRLVFSTTADGAGAPTERLRITSSGSIGIGTATPRAQMHLFGVNQSTANLSDAGGREGFIRLSANSTLAGSGGGVLFSNVQGDSTNSIGYAAIKGLLDNGDVNTTGHIAFSTRQSTSDGALQERMRITSTGRIGVGTSSPQATLDVNSSIRFGNDNTRLIPAGSAGCHVSWNYIEGSAETDFYNLYENALASFLFRQKTGASTAVDVLNIGTQNHICYTNGLERLRIDSSGRLLVGTTGRSNFFNSGVLPGFQFEGLGGFGSFVRTDNDIFGAGLAFAKTRSSGNTIVQNNDIVGILTFQGNDGSEFVECANIQAHVDGTPGANDMPGRLGFFTTADGEAAPAERMRISANGAITLGGGAQASNGAITLYPNNFAGTGFLDWNRATTTTSANALRFQDAGTPVGSITYNNTSTSYNTSSDYRLKENVTAVTNGIARLQQLKPSRFNFIADPARTVDGFLAHEVQDVVPEAITGEKDAMDDDGNPIYQGIDQSKLVPLLTAALQEAIGEIESLKARLTAAGI